MSPPVGPLGQWECFFAAAAKSSLPAAISARSAFRVLLRHRPFRWRARTYSRASTMCRTFHLDAVDSGRGGREVRFQLVFGRVVFTYPVSCITAVHASRTELPSGRFPSANAASDFPLRSFSP